MRDPITGRRISREKYEAREAAFDKHFTTLKAEENAKAVQLSREALPQCPHGANSPCYLCRD